MKIELDSLETNDYFQYISVSSKRDQNGYAIHTYELLPILKGSFEHPSNDLDFLILCSDLQGLVKVENKFQLMGETLPSYLYQFILEKFPENPSPNIGVLLCGDLFTHPDYHGADGEVVSVWEAFSESFKWVVGVAGNHDHFAKQNPTTALSHLENVYFLHKNYLSVDGLKIGGISGIIGKPTKNQRVAEDDFLKAIDDLGRKNLDILLLHSCPNNPEANLLGDERIRKHLEKSDLKNVAAGHVHWPIPNTKLNQYIDIWNTDGRVLLLENRKLKH